MDGRVTLPEGTLLDGSYRIERVVGSGGFGITYMAQDEGLRATVAIKEYYPDDYADRDPEMQIGPKSQRHKQTFDWGLQSFLDEAQTLARFEHPAIVRVARVFGANSTAYMVMRFEQGKSLQKWLDELGRAPTQQELDRIVSPLLDALEMMHAANFLHRDIAPDNVIIRWDGSPVLLDFGSARRAVAQMTRTMTGLIKPGYSPQEQYASDSRLQGPWTDLYALGGTLYCAITGAKPEEATIRVHDDTMKPVATIATGTYRPGFLSAIDACLRVKPKERPQSVAQLRPMLLDEAAERKPSTNRPTDTRRIEFEPRPSSARPRKLGATAKRWMTLVAILILAAGVYGGLRYSQSVIEQNRAALEARKAYQEAMREADAAAAKKAEEDARAAAAEARRKEEEAKRRAESKKLASPAFPPQPTAVPPSNSAWVKLCENAVVDNKTVQICLTHHERLDGETGNVLLSAAVRQVSGQEKQALMVMVPLGMMQQPGMRVAVYPKDLWEKVQRNEKIDETRLKTLKLSYSLCHAAGCTAEIEATPELLADLKVGGGVIALAINASGQPVAFPIPLNGFEETYNGPPIDGKKYAEARQSLLKQIAERQRQKADQAKKQR